MSLISRRNALLAALAAAALAAGQSAGQEPDGMSLGNPKSPVKVVEYASLSCGHCAAFNEQTFPAFKKKYIDTGRVHYTMKEVLTPPQQVAAAGFLMARCAGPSKYFKVVDEVFRSQPRWGKEPLLPVFQGIAKANGMTEAQFEACINDSAGQQALAERVQRGVTQDNVEGTPTFFVNGKRMTQTVPTLADLDAAIAEAAKAGRR